MEWQAWFSLFLTISVLVVLILSSLSPHVVMMAALTLLSVFGVLQPHEALQGFSNPGLITIAAMFVMAAGLQSSGAIETLVRRFLGKPASLRSAMFKLVVPVSLMSGFMNNTPVVATMIPAVNSWCRRMQFAPSKLMIPLSYAAILGGTLTMLGSSTNLIVNGEYQVLTGSDGFSMFFVAMIGVPVTLLSLVFMVLWFPRALPERGGAEKFGDTREFTLEVAVDPDGPLVDMSVAQAGLRQLPNLYLVEIERAGSIVTAVPSEERLKAGDRLIFTGDTDSISDLLRIRGIVASPENNADKVLDTSRAERRLVEAVVSPHCAALGLAIRDARFRDRYGAVVLAVARNGERVRGNLGNTRLQAGDTLLLEARPAFVSRQRYAKDFLLVSDLDSETVQHHRAPFAWATLGAVVVLAATGIMSLMNAALLGAGCMLIFRCCSVAAAERSLDLKVLITIGASFALGMALQKTGVSAVLASGAVSVSHGEAWLLLILVYLSVSLLTEVITNNGAAVLMLPVALSISGVLGVAHEPFVLAIMIAASASFATPLGYQTNLMVYGPGAYKFSDFLKVGLPMNIFVAVISIVLINTFWGLW